MKQEYEKIREELVNSLDDDRIKIIYSSQFYATPEFESIYYEKIKDNPEYFDMYKRWVLSQDPLCLASDDDLYKLRSGIIPFTQDENSDVFKYNRPLLMFFLDLIYPFVKKSVIMAFDYYDLKDKVLKPDQIRKIIEETAIQSLNLCDKETVEKAGYPSLDIAFMDMFKTIFSHKISSVFIKVPDRDEELIKLFETEWKSLTKYSDGLYGFEVVPRILPADIFRYLKLPFKDKKYILLRNTDTYKQTMNYIVSMACSFKPLPDPRIRTYFRDELSELFRPLVKKLVNISIQNGSFILKNETQILEDQLVKELPDIIAEFDFFFATQQNLKEDKTLPFRKLFLPLRGWLVKIGNNADLDEYPLTDYLSKKIKSNIKKYCYADKNSSDISLDKELDKYEEDDEDTRLSDTLSTDKDYNNNDIPQYDAIDKEGSIIGWRINTFAGIINKDKSTLRRWDKDNLLKPKRYIIGKKGYQTLYRAYTEEDLIKAKELNKELSKKARHQK